MGEQQSQPRYSNERYVLKKLEEAFLIISKLWFFLLLSLIAVALCISGYFQYLSWSFFIWSLVVFSLFSLINIIRLTLIVLAFIDVCWALRNYDLGIVNDFSVCVRSLKNLALVCLVFYFFIPLVAMALLLILRNRASHISSDMFDAIDEQEKADFENS